MTAPLPPLKPSPSFLTGKRSMQVAPKRSITGQLLPARQQEMHSIFCYFTDRDVELKFQTYYRHEKQRFVAIHMVCLVALATVFCIHGALERITSATEHYFQTRHSAEEVIEHPQHAPPVWFDLSIFLFSTIMLFVTALACAFHLWHRRGETQFQRIWFDPVELVLLVYCHLVILPVVVIMVACIDQELAFSDQFTPSTLAADRVFVELLSHGFADALYFFLLLAISTAACLLRLQFPYFCLVSLEFIGVTLSVSAVYYRHAVMRWSVFGVFVLIIAMLMRGVWENELSGRSEFLSSVNLVTENRRLSNQNVEMKEELSGKLNYQLHYEMGDILRILCQIKVKMNHESERKDIDKIITALVTNEDLFEVSLDPTMAEYEDEVQGWLHMMAFKEPPPGLYRKSSPSNLFSDRRVRKASVPGLILQAANSRRMSYNMDASERFAGSDLVAQFFVASTDHLLQDDSDDFARWLVTTLRDQFFVDMFYIDQRCASPLTVVFLTCVELNAFGSRLSLDMKKLTGFIGAVESHYFKRNPYHNCLHAGAVVADMNFYLRRLNLDVDDRTFFVGLVAAAAHDVSHPGVSNGFLIATRSKLAITYSDDAVLERMHVAELYRIVSHDKFDIFSHFTINVRLEIRKLMIQMVLATDLSRHFPHISKLKSKKFAVSEETRGLEVTLIMETLLMLSDLGHTAKPFAYHQVWANRISEEFFRQGDAEERHNLPVSPLCDRKLANLPKSQVTFLTLLATPLFETAGQAFAIDEYNTVMSELHGNIRSWQSMIGRDSTETNSSSSSRKDETASMDSSRTKVIGSSGRRSSSSGRDASDTSLLNEDRDDVRAAAAATPDLDDLDDD